MFIFDEYRHVSNINVLLLSNDLFCYFVLCFACTVFCFFNIIFVHFLEKHLVIVLALNAADCWFDLGSSRTKNNNIGICCFSAQHVALRRTIKEWLSRTQNNVPDWRDISTRVLLIQWSGIARWLVQSGHHYHLIDCNLSSPSYTWKIDHVGLHNNHSLTQTIVYILW